MTEEQKSAIIRCRNSGLGYATIAKDIPSRCRGVLQEEWPDREYGGEGTGHNRAVQGMRCGPGSDQEYENQGVLLRGMSEKWWKEHPKMLNKKAVYTYTCAGCGRKFTAYGNSKRKYCSHACYIKDRFKGGGADD